jgi:hypothetical protein
MKAKISRPALGDVVSVYVPKADVAEEIALNICQGSGIVGFSMQEDDDSLVFYYEGNIYGAVNMVDWEDRVKNAYDRMATNYPTSALIYLEAAKFDMVGSTNGKTVTITDQAAVDRWNALGKPSPRARP